MCKNRATGAAFAKRGKFRWDLGSVVGSASFYRVFSKS